MSRFEAGYAMELDQRMKAGEVKEWKRQVPIELRVGGQLICKYYMDFAVTLADNSIVHVECKGYETEVWRLKRKLYEATFLKEHPEIEYQVIKQKNNWAKFGGKAKVRSMW